MRLTVLFSLVCGIPAAQVPDDHVVVVSHTGMPAAASLFDVDLISGAVQPIDRFSLDGFAPLAIAIDGANRDVVVALQTPAATSVLVRLRLLGPRVVQQQSLGDVPGTVTALAQALGGNWITTTDSGVFVTERNGSVARAIATLAHSSAIDTFGLGSSQAVVAQSGSAGSDPRVRWIDLVTGQTIAGPWVYAGYTPLGLTGVGDLPTGASRQVISQDDGTIAISLNFANPTTLPLQPVLPPGATQAMHVRGIEGVVLGGSAHPYLKSFQALGSTQWTILAGPLSGDPVDFAFRPPRLAATVGFGEACGSMALAQASGGGPPRVGNAGYGVELRGAQPSTPAFLALGGSDQRFAGLRLPAVLPGGCRLSVSAEIVFAATTSGLGDAALTLGVPNSAALPGAIVFVQWLQVRGSAIDSSNAGAVWIEM